MKPKDKAGEVKPAWTGALPRLPPLPDVRAKADGTPRQPGRQVPGAVRTPAGAAAEARGLASHAFTVEDDERPWCTCGGCGVGIPLRDTVWGRWDTGDKGVAFVRTKDRRSKMIFYPITVAGRACVTCSLTLEGFRRVAEPAVLMNKRELPVFETAVTGGAASTKRAEDVESINELVTRVRGWGKRKQRDPESVVQPWGLGG